MAPQISTEMQEGLVRRHYASHMDYSRESNVYAKLRGTGLAPEVTNQYDGFIERVYVEGPCLRELFEKYINEPARLAGIYEELCRWYAAYREATKLLLGEAVPDKFILTDKGFVYVDFENVRPGFAEQDIAALVKWMLSYEGGREAAKLFVCVCTSNLDLHPERLEKSLKAELDGVDGAEELIFFLTCAGIVITDGGKTLDTATASLSSAPERYIILSGADEASCPGFETVRTACVKDSIALIARKTPQRNLLFQRCPAETDSALPPSIRIPKDLALELLVDIGEDEDVLKIFTDKQ